MVRKKKAGLNRTMESLSPDDQDYALWLVLIEATRYIFKAIELDMNQYGITPEQGEVLLITKAFNSQLTPTGISRLTCREIHSVGGLVNRMAEKGLVRRAKDLEKKNLVRVVLTNKGRQVYENSKERQSIHSIMSILSEGDRQQLISCMSRLKGTAIDEVLRHYRPPFLRQLP